MIKRYHTLQIAGEICHFNFSYGVLRRLAREKKMNLSKYLGLIEKDSSIMEEIFYEGMIYGCVQADIEVPFRDIDSFLDSLDMTEFALISELFNQTMPVIDNPSKATKTTKTGKK